MARHWTKLGRDLFLYRDTCNIYLLRYGDRGLAIDFGTGAWLDHLEELGVQRVEHVALTHAHRDQLCGLYRGRRPDCAIHAPVAERPLLEPVHLNAFWANYQRNGCPPNYAAPRLPLADIAYDLAADAETRIGPALFCAIATPGHTPGALSYIVEWQGSHLAFCGDAAHAGGTLHQPYHLEWDHWTPSGALAAWHGLERLGYCYFDQLLPAHGSPIRRRARQTVRQTQRRVLPNLYYFGANSYLLVSKNNGGLVIDPQRADIDQLKGLMREIGAEACIAIIDLS